ncbi:MULTISPECIES: ABC transporter ATP-binding protein [unclassified Bacillus (in: firmicutes)]|uniref:ABC transporter ATP-binding protein n=1 Tax=unclassified Bacillus (in: firmicutes) TaxID=185979 RepID=UPI0008E0B5C7|nr:MULTISPECIES: ABC transporter ATP-binding protein [unclassified Bacillus (in: firmicutes)]SFI29630.1 ATP-binding cassette, subfamily C [Bacillus sp. 71mf]SFS38790.1 ATP-binding cassette, subfamily C [Bacillus sp. 103mf]
MEHLLYFAKKLHSFSGKILYINLLGMALVSLLEGIGILLLIPMISISGVVKVNNGSTPVPEMFKFLHNIPETISLLLILGIYIFLVIAQSLLQQNLTLRNTKILINFTNHIRLEIYRALLQANWTFFVKKRKSDLISAMTDELGRVVNGTNLFFQMLTALIFTLIQFGIALWLSVKITIFVLFAGLVLAYFSRHFIKKSRALGNRTSEIARSYLGGITDYFNGVKDIKSNMLEESRYTWLHTWCQKIEQEQLAFIKLKNSSQLFYKVTSSILIAFLVFASVKLFQAQPAQLILIILIFSRLWPRFTTIQSNLEQLAASVPAFKSLIELQEECNKAAELQDIERQYKDVKPMSIEQGIECRNMYFRYNSQESLYALRNINFEIPSNCMTAIVGPSGAGKSTLIDILMGLMQPEKGQILIDGTPLTSDNLLSLRKSISYVPQDPFLFNASIRENLLMIEPNASEEQIWEALEFSAAAEFVRRLPQGLDTFIGDRGVRLSGGERQRLVLARAILRKPSILVLDEATSALDTENEAKIQTALERLKGKMTIIVIAHRLSTIRNADQVLVLDKGEIVQKGAFIQLAKEKKGMFSKLLGNQVEVSV